MTQTDSIADLITRMKNAVRSGKETVVFPHSKMLVAISGALERAGFIEVFPKKGKKIHKHIEVKLLYAGGKPKFRDARRVSKPSKRIYKKIKDVLPVKSGFGHFIMSTPKGVLTDKEARKENVGGEALFQVW